MQDKLWKTAAGLGVPGLALVVFYELYQKFDWPLKDIPAERMFTLLLVFMGVIAVIVLVALFLWRPRAPAIPKPPDGVSVSIPPGWTFKVTAERIANKFIVTFDGFSAAELAAPMQTKDFSAPNVVDALRQIRALTHGKVPAYEVDQAASGQIIVRAVH